MSAPTMADREDVVWALGTGTADLLVLPHAGGNAHAYAEWREHLPESLRLLIGQYPGRGARFVDDLPESVADLAGPVVDCLPEDTGDLVVLGHSMGSLVAFEVARLLTERGTPPKGLIVSACRAPHLANPAPVRAERLDDDELVAAIKARGGTQDEILDEPELREIIVPAIRADFGIDDVYRYTGPTTPLTCPVTVFGGDADPIVPVATLPQWATSTSASAHVEMFAGDHFYFQQDLPPFLARVGQVVQSLLG
ncbi:thioesterase II family protein [Actinokineospora pegani]|uniref:thioesterase II family protein n=1 Tax=Actinokineospora pegani TaxID=2654637 RepID=UPI0012EAD5D4|nr:alpha/beta fold hydrolase [Actinokineospora pegani]